MRDRMQALLRAVDRQLLQWVHITSMGGRIGRLRWTNSSYTHIPARRYLRGPGVTRQFVSRTWGSWEWMRPLRKPTPPDAGPDPRNRVYPGGEVYPRAWKRNGLTFELAPGMDPKAYEEQRKQALRELEEGEQL